MYRETPKTIGEKHSILSGRTMDRRNNSRGVLGDWRADRSFALPVSFRSLFAFRSRRTGG